MSDIPIGAIVGALVVLFVVGFIVLVVVKSAAAGKRRRAMLTALGLQITSETPLVASGTIQGLQVTFEEHNYRAAPRGIAPMFRARVSARGPGLPETALVDKLWDVIGRTQPDMRVALTGHADIDTRFEAFANDDAALAFWQRAMESAVVADCVRNVGRGRLREITLFGGQVTLVADRFADEDRRGKVIDAAVAIALMG